MALPFNMPYDNNVDNKNWI